MTLCLPLPCSRGPPDCGDIFSAGLPWSREQLARDSSRCRAGLIIPQPIHLPPHYAAAPGAMERDGCAGAVLLPTDMTDCWDLGLKTGYYSQKLQPVTLPHGVHMPIKAQRCPQWRGRGPSAAPWGCSRAGTFRAMVASEPAGTVGSCHTLLWHCARAAATFCCTHLWHPVVRSHAAFVTGMWV